MENVNIFKALSSEPRWGILRSLSAGPMSINQLADEVGLKPITVRHHVQTLLQSGLIEVHGEVKESVGRPEVYYRATEKNVSVSFPKRDYLFLAQTLVDGVSAQLGEEEALKLFNRIGEEVGVSLVRGLALEHGVEKWSPEAFKEFFVEGLLGGMGTVPEVVSMGENEITFRERNCLFLEMARSNPNLVCNGLDTGFHRGVVKGLGPGVEGERLKCMGHDDPYCEYAVRFR